MFILLILGVTIYFCHSLIRLCMLASTLPRGGRSRHVTNPAGENGYSGTEQRTRAFAEDEEMEGHLEDGRDEEKDLPPPPPVYGLWRGSVVSKTSLRLRNSD